MNDLNCKKCRRLNQKLFLKGERCFSQKCAMVRRPYAPGIHGKSLRRRVSEFGQQLAEKQKIRFSYGLSEKQLENYFKKIVEQKGNKEDLFVKELESRLDNVVYRLGLAPSRKQARQIVTHGHIFVNNRKTNIPSCQVRKGDEIKLKPNSQKLSQFAELKDVLKNQEVPKWLSFDKEKLTAKVKTEPTIDDIEKVGDISMIIEYYSR
jgi:small subunit ribosomal protein S4